MNESTPLLLFALGIFVGLAAPVLGTKFLGRFGSRTEGPIEGPKNVTVVLPGEAINRVADTISATILTAIEAHINDWKKPSSN